MGIESAIRSLHNERAGRHRARQTLRPAISSGVGRLLGLGRGPRCFPSSRRLRDHDSARWRESRWCSASGSRARSSRISGCSHRAARGPPDHQLSTHYSARSSGRARPGGSGARSTRRARSWFPQVLQDDGQADPAPRRRPARRATRPRAAAAHVCVVAIVGPLKAGRGVTAARRGEDPQ
jgi:hypothetical protein